RISIRKKKSYPNMQDMSYLMLG
ncbi:hypothetical protein HMPREF1072_01413, partial [Bacteroides uniformis CL03T00C23]